MQYFVADFGMNMYEGGLFDLENRLENVKKLGFNGLERLEAGDTEEAVRNAVTFRQMGMDFCTTRGVKAQQGFAWTAAFGKDYVWLRTRESGRTKITLDAFIHHSKCYAAAAAKYGLKSVLHNHLGSAVESESELDEFMEKCPEIYLLLDIGHLAGAGGDVIRVLEKYYDRIIAIHFKDVYIKDETAGLDHWHDRLRFCELGGSNKPGIVPWQEVAEILKKRNYAHKIMIEQDSHLREPLEDLKISIEKLKNIME